MTKKREKPLHLDMSFDEALRRVAQTDPRQLPKPQKKRSQQSGSVHSALLPKPALRQKCQTHQRGNPQHPRGDIFEPRIALHGF
jgi:hypothetical protein